ncbi:hypothetical protein HK098_004104 [Nowakowskiella sp. JEL0407]|nr:hypothetical protein HK098_004104 [Nowakowskiella sp. JEL0407]
MASVVALLDSLEYRRVIDVIGYSLPKYYALSSDSLLDLASAVNRLLFSFNNWANNSDDVMRLTTWILGVLIKSNNNQTNPLKEQLVLLLLRIIDRNKQASTTMFTAILKADFHLMWLLEYALVLNKTLILQELHSFMLLDLMETNNTKLEHHILDELEAKHPTAFLSSVVALFDQYLVAITSKVPIPPGVLEVQQEMIVERFILQYIQLLIEPSHDRARNLLDHVLLRLQKEHSKITYLIVLEFKTRFSIFGEKARSLPQFLNPYNAELSPNQVFNILSYCLSLLSYPEEVKLVSLLRFLRRNNAEKHENAIDMCFKTLEAIIKWSLKYFQDPLYNGAETLHEIPFSSFTILSQRLVDYHLSLKSEPKGPEPSKHRLEVSNQLLISAWTTISLQFPLLQVSSHLISLILSPKIQDNKELNSRQKYSHVSDEHYRKSLDDYFQGQLLEGFGVISLFRDLLDVLLKRGNDSEASSGARDIADTVLSEAIDGLVEKNSIPLLHSLQIIAELVQSLPDFQNCVIKHVERIEKVIFWKIKQQFVKRGSGETKVDLDNQFARKWKVGMELMSTYLKLRGNVLRFDPCTDRLSLVRSQLLNLIKQCNSVVTLSPRVSIYVPDTPIPVNQSETYSVVPNNTTEPDVNEMDVSDSEFDEELYEYYPVDNLLGLNTTETTITTLLSDILEIFCEGKPYYFVKSLWRGLLAMAEEKGDNSCLISMELIKELHFRKVLSSKVIERHITSRFSQLCDDLKLMKEGILRVSRSLRTVQIVDEAKSLPYLCEFLDLVVSGRIEVSVEFQDLIFSSCASCAATFKGKSTSISTVINQDLYPWERKMLKMCWIFIVKLAKLEQLRNLIIFQPSESNTLNDVYVLFQMGLDLLHVNEVFGEYELRGDEGESIRRIMHKALEMDFELLAVIPH